MKNNLMSGIASWKSAALLAIVAMVAAVAFSGVLTNTQTAEAAPRDFPAADRALTVAPGDTVNIIVADAFAQVTITDKSASASFAANGGQSISCSDDDGSCDTDDSDANAAGRQNVAGSVTVVLNIDADSPAGFVLISVNGIGATNTDLTKVITVSKAGLVGSLELKTDAASDKTVTATGGVSNLTVTVKNASTPPTGLTGQTVSVITTHGTVGCGSGAGTANAGTSQTCSAASDAAGVVDVILTGGGVEGTATVTATLGTRTATATVTLFGSAKNLTAEPDQGSIEIGGSTYIVLTVTDGAGNPVSGQTISPVQTPAVEVTGPSGTAADVLVTTEKDTAEDTTANPSVPAGRGYSKDKPAAGAAPAIPACGDDNAHIGEAAATYDELFGSDDAAGTSDDGEGTNAAGQCVVQVTAPEANPADPTTKDATRGVHTLNFAIGAIKASATIEVAGKPNSISTDLSDTVDPASVTKVTVSVFDDEEVLVGITDVNVRKVGGDGLVENAGTSTVNGQSTFTFIAPSSAGSAEILITAGDVNHRVTINIGEPAPEGPAPTWNKPLAAGTHNLVWNGADGADPADAGDNIVAIWQWTGSGWDGYFADAGDVGLANTLTELSNGEAYWVVVQ